MKNKKLIDKWYMISRFIIAILTFIILSIIHKDSSLNLIYLIFALIAFGISFPSSVISKKIINNGNKIENKTMRVLYAVALLIIIIVLLFLLYTIIPFVFESLLHRSSFNDAIRQALIGVFIIIVGTVCVVVPYVQTIIVLILAKFIKE